MLHLGREMADTSLMTTHHCTDRCSHRATVASLTAIGFPVRVVEKVCGSPVVLVEGVPFETARNLATEAGLLRTCTRTERSAR